MIPVENHAQGPVTSDCMRKHIGLQFVNHIHAYGKSFTQSSSFRVHDIIHTGIKPFACDTCGQSFVQLGGLKMHEITHTQICILALVIIVDNYSHGCANLSHVKEHIRCGTFQLLYYMREINRSQDTRSFI